MVTGAKNSPAFKSPHHSALPTRKSPTQTHPHRKNSTAHWNWARYYHAELGRFISRDPIGYVDGMNLYRPYFVPGAVDPTGTVICICDHIVAAMGSGAGMGGVLSSIESCDGDCSSLNTSGGFSSAGGQGGFVKRCRPFISVISPPSTLVTPSVTGVEGTSWESEFGEWSNWILVRQRKVGMGGSFCTYEARRKVTFTGFQVYSEKDWGIEVKYDAIEIPFWGPLSYPHEVYFFDYILKKRFITIESVQTKTASDAVCGECPKSRPKDHDFSNK
jgi:RHS repeat-associated protein